MNKIINYIFIVITSLLLVSCATKGGWPCWKWQKNTDQKNDAASYKYLHSQQYTNDYIDPLANLREIDNPNPVPNNFDPTNLVDFIMITNGNNQYYTNK